MKCRGSLFCSRAAALALGFFVGGVQARDTWIEPERPAVAPGATTLWLTSADAFDVADIAEPSEDVGRTLARLASAPVSMVASTATDKALPFSVTLPRAGVAGLAVELKARRRELEPDQIEPYLREIHADDDLRAVWAAVKEPRRWREDSVRHAKTFVRAGEPAADDRSWAEPLGLALEIVPERDPTELRAGEVFPVRVLRAGTPLAGFTIAFVSAGETHEHVVVTDGLGRASAPLGLAGRWLLRGTDLRRTAGEDREWVSDVTTLLVNVK